MDKKHKNNQKSNISYNLSNTSQLSNTNNNQDNIQLPQEVEEIMDRYSSKRSINSGKSSCLFNSNRSRNTLIDNSNKSLGRINMSSTMTNDKKNSSTTPNSKFNQ